ncbi:MAG TPA: hypothetical protein VEY91_09750 [Candidatus Limnocylindria bacterium]|nr:hypothetical protein [Candidatus Limnocylindria bacterium]
MVAGCAATGPAGEGARTQNDAGSAGARVTIEVSMQRSLELIGSRDQTRIRDGALGVEFRQDSSPALDAGEVSLEGRVLERDPGSGARRGLRYVAAREILRDVPSLDAEGWAVLVATGSAAFPPCTTRVQLAPTPEVLEPAPGQTMFRTDGLVVVLSRPAPGAFYRVSLSGPTDVLRANEFGRGRWEFAREDLATVAAGPARIVIEVETSCGDCPAGEGRTVRWTTRTELEVPISLI